MPKDFARSSVSRRRPTPTTCSTTPAFFKASANEPPISPTPKITIFLKGGMLGASAYDGLQSC